MYVYFDIFLVLFVCAVFLQVDVDENPLIAKAEGLTFIPTFKIYKNGHKLKEMLGPSEEALECVMKQYSS
jgi:DnaJ family protein C protein 7